MDKLYVAQSLLRRRKLEECVEACTVLLEENPRDEAVWYLKIRALSEQLYVDETDAEEEGIAEVLMDDTAIAELPRPGTSLKKPLVSTSSARAGPTPGMRPTSQSGRPLTGFLRPGSQAGRPTTVEETLLAPRSASTARPVTSASGRYVRLGTASMLTEPGGPFLDVSKLDLNKYAQKPALARVLFEYLYYHENDTKNSLELAAISTAAAGYQDWWWKVQLGKCYLRLGMLREAEQQLRSSLKNLETVDCYLYLAKVYTRLDQPLSALKTYEQGLQRFPEEILLLVCSARIHEALNDTDKCINLYKQVLQLDNTNIESIACIATHHFYSDQPEIALRFYHRLLQMGVYNAEIYNNLALCSFYAQQYDMCMCCFQRAIDLSSYESAGDVWYNLGNVLVAMGQFKLSYQCYKLALSSQPEHAEAYNNLAVLEYRRDRREQARSYLLESSALNPRTYEPHFNLALLSDKAGDLQSSYKAVNKSLEAYPDHSDSKELLRAIESHFTSF